MSKVKYIKTKDSQIIIFSEYYTHDEFFHRFSIALLRNKGIIPHPAVHKTGLLSHQPLITTFVMPKMSFVE